MEDFRNEFYKKYVTTYKQYTSDDTIKAVVSDWKWYKFRCLPLLRKYSRDVKILELGCGDGRFIQFLRSSGFTNVEGIEISEEQTGRAKEKGLNVYTTDATEFLTSCTGEYDIILALDFIEHFGKEEIVQLFRKIYNSLRKGGMLIIRTPNGHGLFPNRNIYGDLTHVTIFTPNSLSQILRLVEFNEIESYETGPVPKNLAGAIRLILWKCIKICVYVLRIIETGSYEKILTQDFICCAIKNE